MAPKPVDGPLAHAVEDARPGYIIDFISKNWVRDTPEERNAVQVFARKLVDDYGYDSGQIQTHPQYRVRKRPSDEQKGFPVDIAVFRDARKTEDNLLMVVECKKPKRKDGEHQLKLYMDMCAAEIGVWFNGHDHLYLRKFHHKDGRRVYKELPNIPRAGERIEDIGLYRKSDLRKPSNLKSVFKDLRNHLAGMTTGITRDEALAQEIINILFCKIYDEINTPPNDIVTFRSGVGETKSEVKRRIVRLFKDHVKSEYPDVFDARDSIRLDADSLVYVVGELQNYCITEADRDAVGDAFEVFIGPALRGSEGQFFTPRNVVKMVVSILDPSPGEMIIDPACGSGGFLISSLEHVWSKIDREGAKKKWSDNQIWRRKRDVATRYFRGIDKDAFLSKVTKAYMAIVGDGRGGVFCENSLVSTTKWQPLAQDQIQLGKFDVVVTNPPFGKKIVVTGADILSQYDLGSKWDRNKNTDEMEKTSKLLADRPPQILFLERCLQLLKTGGRLGIVLPEAIFGMPTYEYVVQYLLTNTRILGVVSMPESLFKTSGKVGTHAKVVVLFAEKGPPTDSDYSIFMAEAKWCGHDSRGNPTIKKMPDGSEILLDDVPKIADRFHELVGE